MLVAAAIMVALTSCTHTSGSSTRPSQSSAPDTLAPMIWPAANEAGKVTVTAIPTTGLTALHASHRLSSTVLLPIAPTVRSIGTAQLRAGHQYTVSGIVDVANRSVVIEMVAVNALDIEGLRAFLAPPGHRYHIAAVLTPMAGGGHYSIIVLDPVTRRALDTTTAPFNAR